MSKDPQSEVIELEKIKNSHTMKLVPISQRELFWSELEPQILKLTSEQVRKGKLQLLDNLKPIGSWTEKEVEIYIKQLSSTNSEAREAKPTTNVEEGADNV